jgi:protein-tyrosine-phosphatase
MKEAKSVELQPSISIVVKKPLRQSWDQIRRSLKSPTEIGSMPSLSQGPINVLVLCSGNSARSILAEALLNRVAPDRIRGFSAGSHPKSSPNPFALEKLRWLGIDTAGFRSKSWTEFAVSGAPAVDIIVTVCDDAAGESCPYWPGHPVIAHWGIPDPAAVTGNDEEKQAAFDLAYARLKARVDAFAALPLETLFDDPAQLKARLDQIGHLEDATKMAQSS